MYEREVENGMKLLDRARPGWWKEIDLGALDLSQCMMCMLGQLYGRYTYGLSALAVYMEDEPEDYGFYLVLNVDDMFKMIEWEKLTATWEKKIRERRELMAEFDTAFEDAAQWDLVYS